MSQFNVDEVKRTARGRWGEILPAVAGINSECLDGRHCPCPDPACGGKDRFRALDDFADTGAVYCNVCFNQRNGDGLAAIQHYNGIGFSDALAAVAEHLGVVERSGETPATNTGDPLRSQFVAAGTSTESARSRVDAEFYRFCTAKPPITPEALNAVGAELVTWPASNQHGQTCIAFKAEIRPGETTGYILRRADGKDFAGFARLQPRKTHMVRGSADGWVIPGGWDRLARARVVWIVEGVPDALALFAVLPDDHAVATNICGAKACPQNIGVFAGKVVFVVGDADSPGQEGAVRKATKMQSVAESVKTVTLPYEIEQTHGKDLRDYFVDGRSFAELLAIAERAPEFEKPKRGGKSRHVDGQYGMNRPDREPVDPWVDIAEDQGRTEVANSRRFLARHKAKVRYCHLWGKWLVWGGERWQIDDSGAVLRLGKEVADSIWIEAGEFKTDDIIKFAVDTSKAGKIASFLKLAAAEVPVDVAELDANPWLFNCANGTIDLRTGELRPHRQEDSITKICRTAFIPDASSYHFDRFLESTFGNQTLVDFLRRLMGYCLTGRVTEQILPVFWGKGSNGKSTLLEAVQYVIGTDYAHSAPASLLMEKKHETHPTELADLFGRRLMVAAETNQGARLAESTVKQLTGGDVITARRMREDFWTFTPTHKLILQTNHKPSVKGTDHAIWRRLVLVPFTQTFWNPTKGETGPPELQQDKTLPDKLKAEAEGILAWMVRGCLEWQQGGLQIPEIVRAATKEYRSESDIVGRFIDQCCITGDKSTFRVRFSSLYELFEAWCKESGDNVPSRKFVGQYLQEHDYPDKQSGARWYLGIAIREMQHNSCDESSVHSATEF